jgi:excisionase family DNA binding protein
MKSKVSQCDDAALSSVPSKSDRVGPRPKGSRSASEKGVAEEAEARLAGDRPHPRSAQPRPLKEKFFAVDQVAEILNVSQRTVRRWIAGKKLIAHDLEGIIRVADCDLRTFIALGRRI